MRLIHECDRAALLIGDAAALDLPEHSVDALVTDPPAGIGFMGLDWDADRRGLIEWSKWLRDVLAPSYAALKPGGHGLVWALPRTAHWTACALELVGFEIRDVIAHFFGSGMPKGLTPASGLPSGGRTLLKPQREDWFLVRKPFERRSTTVPENLEKWGVGCIWVDGSPLEGDRVPGHVVLSHEPECALESECAPGCAVRELDDRAGPRRTGGRAAGTVRKSGAVYNDPDQLPQPAIAPSRGAASRYFYCAKPTRAEKEVGLEDFEAAAEGEANGRRAGSAGNGPRAGAGRTAGAKNIHPTVKSTALMRWMVGLVTRPGHVVLDPFAGSGSTGVAALELGRRFVGCELAEDPRYEAILRARIIRALADCRPGVGV